MLNLALLVVSELFVPATCFCRALQKQLALQGNWGAKHFLNCNLLGEKTNISVQCAYFVSSGHFSDVCLYHKQLLHDDDDFHLINYSSKCASDSFSCLLSTSFSGGTSPQAEA